MKVGDIVNFYTGAWVFQHAMAEYRSKNPGVIVEASDRKNVVLWADGSITTEHSGYLEKDKKCSSATK